MKNSEKTGIPPIAIKVIKLLPEAREKEGTSSSKHTGTISALHSGYGYIKSHGGDLEDPGKKKGDIFFHRKHAKGKIQVC